jgi:UDP-N-acetylmuramate dehydrogenase
MRAIETIRERMGERLRSSVALSGLTTYGVGGEAEYLAEPSGEAEAEFVYREAVRHGIPVTVIGWGSNVIAPDEGIGGLVIRTRNDRARVSFPTRSTVYAEAGAGLMAIAREAATRGLGGMEAIAGIPGTLGGAIVMNAGTNTGDLSSVLVSVTAITPAGRRRTVSRDEAGFGYRRSIFQDSGWLILGARLRLTRSATRDVIERLERIGRERAEKFPLDIPSAGSVFKRPPGDYAGRLIEAAGCKGLRVGGAMVSERHANFIVNAGGATAGDILGLITELRRRVFDSSGVWLEMEQIPLSPTGAILRYRSRSAPPPV